MPLPFELNVTVTLGVGWAAVGAGMVPFSGVVTVGLTVVGVGELVVSLLLQAPAASAVTSRHPRTHLVMLSPFWQAPGRQPRYG